MAKERLKSPRARLFVALDLPEALRQGIVAWGRKALADPALRPVAPQSLHVTLAFLGWLPEKEIPRLAEIVEGAGGPAPRLELEDPVPRPARGRPRLFALPASSPAAVDLQAGLQTRLVAARLYEPEKRPFWPHVTVARVRREERGSSRPAFVSRPPGALPKALLQATDCVRMTLYRSELKPQGAEYTPLAQVKLPAGGRQ
ncbi:MAG TPA: RNA 2',3'-cyclic phosphodiesterase [Solirubrobacterales bacterium]|jgi:2'-5' RNA ligase|nr:RNA 2',3'-cyclic phosphodiesterase [Solirubrobacterales bacterium]